MRIAVLGAGIMGAAIARNLMRAGHSVVVWNRTREKAEAVGSEVAETPATAASGAEVVLTILADWTAVEAALTGSEGAIRELGDGAIWLQMSTVGIPATERAIELAGEAGATLLDAPVVGTKEPAEKGELLVLASGPDHALDTCEPIFATIGRKTIRLGEAGRGNAFKLVLNTWLLGVVESLAETIALARTLGFDPKLFLGAIAGGPLDSGYAQLKGKAMAEEQFPPSFLLRLARKDAALVREAAEAHGLNLPGIQAALGQLERAHELGLGDEDMAAVVEVTRPGLREHA